MHASRVCICACANMHMYIYIYMYIHMYPMAQQCHMMSLYRFVLVCSFKYVCLFSMLAKTAGLQAVFPQLSCPLRCDKSGSFEGGLTLGPRPSSESAILLKLLGWT